MSQPRPELDTRRPFTRTDAIAAGIPAAWLRSSRFRRLFRGVYVDSRVPVNPATTAEAALLLVPRAARISHESAADLLGLPVTRVPETQVTVTRASHRVTHEQICCHVGPTSTYQLAHGLRVSTPVELFLELAGRLCLVDLVVVGDAMVRLRMTTPEDLVGWCAGESRRHSRAARRAAGYVRAEVDSPMETRLRMLLVLAGLPEPEVNHRLLDDRGRVRRRFDLSYQRARLIVEYDGRQHAEDFDQWESDLDRREEFDETGWRIIVVTSRGIYREPGRTLDRVVRALRSRGMRVAGPNGRWQAHFPTR